MMRAFLSLSYVLAMAALSCYAQESHLQSDFRREADDLRTNCTSFNLESMTSCGQVLFTGAPLHIAVGSLAPQNGVGFGPAFVAHSTPNELWRLSWNVDAVGTMNGSWRAGVYMKAIRTPVVTITPVISGAGTPPPSNLTVRDSTVFNLYTQAISLNTVDYFGLGPSTARSERAIFGVRQTVVGGNVIFPIVPKLKLSLFGEVNGRFVAVRSNPGQSSPSIEQLIFSGNGTWTGKPAWICPVRRGHPDAAGASLESFTTELRGYLPGISCSGRFYLLVQPIYGRSYPRFSALSKPDCPARERFQWSG